MRKNQTNIFPNENIIKKIIVLREEKVLPDVHLAELYGVETRSLKQAVRRNINRFPKDFMFQLNEQEIKAVVSQFVIPHKKYFGGAKPYAFTEIGVAMLSSVLKSEKAVQMNVMIMRTFVALRKIALNYSAVMRMLEAMKSENDQKFREIYSALEYLIGSPSPPRTRIGFKP